MAKLKIPFQFSCTVTTGKLIRERPRLVDGVVKAMAEAVHFFKTKKQASLRIMAKYTRGWKPEVMEGLWAAYTELLQEDMQPTLEGLRDTLAVQADWDPKAGKAKAEDFVDLRFVNDLKQSGFIDKLYGRTQMSRK